MTEIKGTLKKSEQGTLKVGNETLAIDAALQKNVDRHFRPGEQVKVVEKNGKVRAVVSQELEKYF